MKNLQSGSNKNNNFVDIRKMKAAQSHAVMESPFEEEKTSTLPRNLVKP